MKDLIVYTGKLRKECKELAISPRERAFIDLVALGWEQKDAYQIVGLSQPSDSDYKIRQSANDLLVNMPPTMSYYQRMQGKQMPQLAPTYDAETKKRNTVKEGSIDTDENAEFLNPDFDGNYTVTDEDLGQETSKEYQLREWIIAKRKYTVGSKPWMDAQKAIADLTQAKKEKTQAEEKHTKFFLPLHCYNCSLFIENQKKRKK